MVQFDRVCLSRGEKAVLKDLSFTVSDGQRVAITGSSGIGKTSVLRLIAGLIKPTSGTVTVRGLVSYAFQEPRLLPWRTALENVNAVLGDKKATLPEAAAWLETVELSDAAEKFPSELSGGMAQRVNLARAMCFGSDILLLDEPMSGIDPVMRHRLLTHIDRHCKNRTLILVTHDSSEADALGCSILSLS